MNISEISLGIITMSDRASSGQYKDESGPLVEKMTSSFFDKQNIKVQTETVILPDSEEMLRTNILLMKKQMQVIVITGGTGLGPRDISPDVVNPMLTKKIPGIMEMIRVKYGMNFPNALLSRALAGVINDVLIYVIPGSPKAVKEYMDEILPTITHSLKMIHGGSH